MSMRVSLRQKRKKEGREGLVVTKRRRQRTAASVFWWAWKELCDPKRGGRWMVNGQDGFAFPCVVCGDSGRKDWELPNTTIWF